MKDNERQVLIDLGAAQLAELMNAEYKWSTTVDHTGKVTRKLTFETKCS